LIIIFLLVLIFYSPLLQDCDKHIEEINSCQEEIEHYKELPIWDMSPTFSKVKILVRENQIDKAEYNEDFNCVEFSFGLIKAFAEEKMYSCIAWIIFTNGTESHSLVAVNTSDEGLIYIEPQEDKIMKELSAGENYCKKVGWDCDWKIEKIKSCFSEINY